MATAKSLTCALALALATIPVAAAAVSWALLLSAPGSGGIRLTLIVVMLPEFRVPRLQVTAPEETPPQELELVPAKVAPEIGTKSVKVTPDTASPVLVMVYTNETWLPTPVCDPGPDAVMVKLTLGPILLTKASLGPESALCNGVRVGKFGEAV